MGILSTNAQRQRNPRGTWETETTSFVRWTVQLPWLGTVQQPTWNGLLFPWLVKRACHSPGASQCLAVRGAGPLIPLGSNSNTLTGEGERAESV